VAVNDLSNGELLRQLRELAMEARDRCAVYVEDARDEGGDVGNALTFVVQVGDALSPRRAGFFTLDGSVRCIKAELDEVAKNRPTPQRDGELSWETFLAGHPELKPTLKPKRAVLEPLPHVKAELRVFKSVDLSPERVLEALRQASENGQPVSVSAVARVLIEGTKVKPGTRPWRRVIAKVTVMLRRAASQGEVLQHRPEDSNAGRVTCRWEAVDA
jgi:hypothetical protein